MPDITRHYDLKSQHLMDKINTKLCTLTRSLQMFVKSQFSSRTAAALLYDSYNRNICPKNVLNTTYKSFVKPIVF